MRLQKFLSRAGVASRREAERLIAAGRVRVNGERVEVGASVDPSVDEVRLDGAPVRIPKTRWLLFHKPPGVLTTKRDPGGGETVFDRIGPAARGLRYVGRLDRDTAGLLLLTNDGDTLNRLTHPRYGVEREYRVEVSKPLTGAAITRLGEGVLLEDGPARAVRVEWPSERVVHLVLTEGRKREVRRMMDAVGHPVARLTRLRFGPITLGTTKPGEWRDLKADEVEALATATRTP